MEAATLLPTVLRECREALAARLAGTPRTLVLPKLPPLPSGDLPALPPPRPRPADDGLTLTPGIGYPQTEVQAMAADLAARRFQPKAKPGEAPIAELVAIWNEAARPAGLARCHVLNDERRKRLRERWAGQLGGNLELWRACCEAAARSPWCRKTRATIDHLLWDRTCATYVDRVMGQAASAPPELIAALDAAQADAWRRLLRRIAVGRFEQDTGRPPSDADDLAAVEAIADTLAREMPDPEPPQGRTAAAWLLRPTKTEDPDDRRH